ncbi:MAG: TrkA C-terminal domain-containing protein [Candidatus Bathyarchaeota archaeon]|nr:TrkA C-terminal domain-containing protein [Candidatus Bathyarchaeota archaeon]
MDRVKKIRFKAVPVRETLVEMKNISEVMIDLAYSAAIMDNKPLAEEVAGLEKRMDDLVYQLNMNLMLSARDRRDAEALAGVQRVGALTNAISDAAGDIASLVLKGIKVHPVAREVFERTEENLEHASVVEGSIIEGKSVGELHLARRIGADIIAIRRGEHWLVNPGKEMLMPGDMVLARGTQEGLAILIKAAKGEVNELE